MTNNKIMNLIKVAAVLLLLCGMVARPQAADSDDIGIAIGVTFGTQFFSGIENGCEESLSPGWGYVCDRAALVGSPYLRIEAAPHHSVIFAYRISGEYEQTYMHTSGREIRRPYSTSTGSLAYEYRAPFGGTGKEEAFIKAGYHFTEADLENPGPGDITHEMDGVLLGVGVVYNETLLAGYEYFDAGEDFDNGHLFYLGVEFSP